MAEYIERQTVVDMLQNLSYDDWNQGASTTWANAFSECAKMIRDIPPADVRPVRRGRWIVKETAYEDTEARCSECGFTTLINEPGNGLHMLSDLNYCPGCGSYNCADMRGGDAE